ncbi:MAG TPA: tRNA-uridine aminocarboxypropyltransferase [Stellaceae bacterium]|nr:tRNA-uridine aminocarboxypropyltransferase [Stellaceae bacterium]
MSEQMPTQPEAPPPTSGPCSRCGKPAALCVCDDIVPIDHRIAVLILQHPQEQDVELGTARLTALALKHAMLKVGLSWPSLAKPLGRTADPQRWAVLYLGSAKGAELAAGRDIVMLDRRGAALADQETALAGLEGIIVLDGTWSQAKALWWRNPWLLKCRRVVLAPRRASRYGSLRREPRRDSLSTLEAVAMVLGRVEGRPEIEETLLRSFGRLLERYRAAHGEVRVAPRPRRRGARS